MLALMPIPKRLALCAALACFAATAQAQLDTELLPADGARQPKWEAGVAGVAVTVPDYPASDENRSLALPAPYFVYHGRVLRSDDEEGSRLRQKLTPNIELSISGGGALSSDSKDSDARRGMPDLGYLLEVGPNLRLSFDGPRPQSKILVDLPVRAVTSVQDFEFDWRGLLFAPEIAYQSERFLGGKLKLRAEVGVDFGTTLLQRYFYDVAPQYATVDRPAYAAHAGYLGASFGTRASYAFSRRVRGFVGLGYDQYAGAASDDSPLFRSRHGYSAVTGFSWSFLQSREFAEE